MRELKNGTKIIGVDTGYGNIKTANTVTPTGLIKYDTPPIFSGNILEYNGKYYRFGEGHKDFIADKTADEDFYILTLAAIARELKRSRICSADVYLAEGLPLTWVRVQRGTFKAYLMRNKTVEFRFADNDYHINFVGCSIYPQGYPAVIERIDEFKGTNMLADIGSGTINILYINNKKPIESKSWTEKLGVNQCAVRIENALMDNFGIKTDRSITDHFLKHGTADIHPDYLACMNRIAADYTDEIFNTLYKYEYNPNLMRLWITGGGGKLVKNFGKYDSDRVTVVDDICAAAKGLEYIADAWLRRGTNI